MIRLVILCLVLLPAFLTSTAEGRPLTRQEEATLSEGGIYGAAQQLAFQLGREHNEDAIPMLISINRPSLLCNYALTYNSARSWTAPPSPNLEALVVAYLKDTNDANPRDGRLGNLRGCLVAMVKNYRSKELFDVLYQSSKQSLLLAQSPRSAVESSFYPGLNLLATTDIEGIEEPVAQLLPLASDGRQVEGLVSFLRQKRYLPAVTRLSALLERSPIGLTGGLIHALADMDTSEATAALGERLAWIEMQPAGVPRDSELADIVEVLARYGGDVPRTAQEGMDRIEADLTKIEISVAARHRLDGIFLEHKNRTRTVARLAAERAPIPGPWTQDACERTAQEQQADRGIFTVAAGERRESVAQTNVQALRTFVPNQAFCYGLAHKHTEVFEACVQYPIDFNRPCKGGSIPLYFAVQALDEGTIDKLIRGGADPKRPWLPAAPHSNNLVETLVWTCGPKKPMPPACERVLRQLVRLGANANGLASAPIPPIHRAANFDNTALISLLLELGADINRADQSGGTATDYAFLRNDHKSTLEFLRARGGYITPWFQAKAAASGAALMLCFSLGACKM